MRRGWRRVGPRPSPKSALAVEVDGKAEARDAKPVARPDRAPVFEVVPADDVAGGHAIELGDGAHGVPRTDHVDSGCGRVSGRSRGRDDLRSRRDGRDDGLSRAAWNPNFPGPAGPGDAPNQDRIERAKGLKRDAGGRRELLEVGRGGGPPPAP